MGGMAILGVPFLLSFRGMPHVCPVLVQVTGGQECPRPWGRTLWCSKGRGTLETSGPLSASHTWDSVVTVPLLWSGDHPRGDGDSAGPRLAGAPVYPHTRGPWRVEMVARTYFPDEKMEGL